MTSKIRAFLLKFSVVLLLASGFVSFATVPEEAEAVWCQPVLEISGPEVEPTWFEDDAGCPDSWIALQNTEQSPVITRIFACETESFTWDNTISDPLSSSRYYCRNDEPLQVLSSSSDAAGFNVAHRYTASCVGTPVRPSIKKNDDGSTLFYCDGQGATDIQYQRTETIDTTPPADPGSGDDGGDFGDLENPGQLQTAEPQTLGCAEYGVEGQDSPIMCKFIEVVRFLSIGVTVVAAITVAVVGMQYTASRGDPSKTAQAVNRLVKVGSGIVVYIFGWALLEWIIPGGAI